MQAFDEWFVGITAKTFYGVIWGATGFLLLVISAKVANLFVVHATARSHELAIQLALGASRYRLVRQFVCEGLMLSTADGVIGRRIAHIAVALHALPETGSPLSRCPSGKRRRGPSGSLNPTESIACETCPSFDTAA